MSEPRIADGEQLPEGTWAQIRKLVTAGQDALDVSIATGISQARAERYRRELSFKPPSAAKKKIYSKRNFR